MMKGRALVLLIAVAASGCVGMPIKRSDILQWQESIGVQVRAQAQIVQTLGDRMRELELATTADRQRYLKNSEANARTLQDVSRSLSSIAQQFEGLRCVPAQ